MPCYGFKTQHGTAIICTGRQAKPRCRCGKRSEFQCDFPAPGRQSGTCDKHLCKAHARVVGEDRHYCIDHTAPAQRDLFAEAS